MSIASVASTLAAFAALITLLYARATVHEARRARQDASAAHTELVGRQAELLEESRRAQAQELAARERALQRELWLGRLTQLGKLQNLLGETADIARSEIVQPPPQIEGQRGTWSRLPGALARAEAALVILEQLGGPQLPKIRQKIVGCNRIGIPPAQVAGETMSALATTIHLAENDPHFLPPTPDR